MPLKFIEIEETDSTNTYLQTQRDTHNIRGWVVSARHQTAGKGMGSNTWESEAGQNLTFSMALDMSFLSAAKQFELSKAVPVAIVKVLNALIPSHRFQIKWPNDIFCEGQKVGGILINSTIKGGYMGISIIGVGLNVNQEQFHDWPTHPTSLRNLTGTSHDLDALLHAVAESIHAECASLKERIARHEDNASADEAYFKHLFRYRTWAYYEVEGEHRWLFMKGIDAFGRLQLYDKKGNAYTYDIKEVKFVL